jgi:hypothetical protein
LQTQLGGSARRVDQRDVVLTTHIYASAKTG